MGSCGSSVGDSGADENSVTVVAGLRKARRRICRIDDIIMLHLSIFFEKVTPRFLLELLHLVGKKNVPRTGTTRRRCLTKAH